MGSGYKAFLHRLDDTKNEPFLIEYNVRMGDPECQTILPKLKTNLLDIINVCCTNELNKLKLNG